jgi:hypothetical protein
MVPKKEFPIKDFEGLYIVQIKDKEKRLPDGSRITFGTDYIEKMAVFCESSPYKKGKLFLHNFKTGKIFVDGTEGSIEDLRAMRGLIDYMQKNVKDYELETLIIATKGKEVK